MSVPTLIEVLQKVVGEALAKSADKIVRLEHLAGVPISEAIASLDPDEKCRFGITASLRKGRIRRRGVSDNAREITRWRNEPITTRRAKPLIILGDATGREEAGLRKVPCVIRETDVLRTYGDLLSTYVSGIVESDKPRRLATALVRMAIEGLIDASELALFCEEGFQSERTAVQKPQEDLWRLRLIPDARAMDTESPGTRLSLNYQVVELLLNQSDTSTEERQIQRVEDAAEAGDATAIAALKFRRSRSKLDLQEVELDTLLAIINKSGPAKPSAVKRHIAFFEALDRGLVESAVLSKIDQQWDLSRSELTYADEIATDIVLRMSLDRDEDQVLTSDENEQLLATHRPEGTLKSDSTSFVAGQLIEAAETADALQGRTTYAPLVRKLIGARALLEPLHGWRSKLFELLLIKIELRDAAETYLRTWEELVDEILRDRDPATVEGLRRLVALLDSHWEMSLVDGVSGPITTELMPTHPFVLKPIVSLVDHARLHLTEEDLGSQLRWAYDRTLPAYPAVWYGNDLYVHQSGSTTPVFSKRPKASQPSVSTKTGLIEVVRSYVGLHPYTAKHLSLLLIDPPGGGGVQEAVTDLTRSGLVEDVSVFLANTGRREPDVSLSSGRVEHLGSVGDVAKWLSSTPISVHVTVWFQRPRVAELGSHSGTAQPSRGLHNALSISLVNATGGGMFGSATGLVPQVSVQPRDSNAVVRKLMELARQSYGADRLYQVDPMLPQEDVELLKRWAERTDWVVLASPGPMGLVPPRTFPDNFLTYLGREDLGIYGLFVFASDLFSVRKKVQQRLIAGPMAPQRDEIEKQLEILALTTPNGILRIGRSENSVLEQIGVIAASHFARTVAARE